MHISKFSCCSLYRVNTLPRLPHCCLPFAVAVTNTQGLAGPLFYCGAPTLVWSFSHVRRTSYLISRYLVPHDGTWCNPPSARPVILGITMELGKTFFVVVLGPTPHTSADKASEEKRRLSMIRSHHYGGHASGEIMYDGSPVEGLLRP